MLDHIAETRNTRSSIVHFDRRWTIAEALMEPLTHEEILAMLKANRALGPEYDKVTAQQILDRMAAPSTSNAPDPPRPGKRRIRKSPIAYLVLSIPLLAIAGHYASSSGVFAVLALDAIIILADLMHPTNR